MALDPHLEGELLETMYRLDERKTAIGMTPADHGAELTKETALRLLTGLDLDPDELEKAIKIVAIAVGLAIVNTDAPVRVAVGFWLDGLTTGLMLAEDRQRA